MNSPTSEKKGMVTDSEQLYAVENQGQNMNMIAAEYPLSSELRKKLNRPAVIAFGYLTVTTWSAYSTASATALVAGGLNVFFWGLLIVVFCNVCAAASLAEPASLYPFGNQASWSLVLSPKRIGRSLSYTIQWFILSGYSLLALSATTLLSQMLLAMAQITHPNYEIKPLHYALTIDALTICLILVGMFGSKIIAKANITSLIWNLCGFITISLFMLIQSRGHYNNAKTAFVTVSNQSGWSSSFVPWVSGLSQAALSTTAFDAVAHLAPEMYSPHRDVPFGMLSAIGTNGIVGLIYAVIFVFCLPANAFGLLSTPTGFPFGQFLLILAKGSQVGTVFLILILFIPLLLTVVDVYVTASRILCTFARQGGLPEFTGKINQKFDAPIYAFILMAIINISLAWIYKGSTAAFNAFISAPVVILGWTYSAVAACMLFYGRPIVQIKTKFSLGNILGPFANIITIIFYLCLTVFLSIPSTLPVSATSMNYTSVILVATIIAPILSWFLYAKKHYQPIVVV